MDELTRYLIERIREELSTVSYIMLIIAVITVITLVIVFMLAYHLMG